VNLLTITSAQSQEVRNAGTFFPSIKEDVHTSQCPPTECNQDSVAHLISDMPENCLQGMTTLDQIDCLDEQYKKQDEKLNAIYQKDLAKLSPESCQGFYAWHCEQQKQALQKAQKLWVQYRDANCNIYAKGGGTIAGIQSTACFLNMTTNRAQELEELLEP